MITFFTLVLALGLVVGFWRRPVWGLYWLVAVLPLERLGSWALNPATGHPAVRLSQIVGAAFVMAVAGQAWRRRQFGRPPLALWLLLGLLASSAASAGLTGHTQLLRGVIAVGFVVSVVYAIYLVGQDIRWGVLGKVLLASGMAVALFGVWQFVAGALGMPAGLTGLRPEYSRAVFGFPRVQSTALEPLYFANYLLLPILVGAAFALSAQVRRWWRPMVAVGGMFLAFVLTMSRGAFGGLAVATLVAAAWSAWQLGRRRRLNIRRVAAWLGAGVGIAVVALAMVGCATWISERDFTKGPRWFAGMVTTELTRTDSFKERTAWREQAMQIFQAHPWLGVGLEGISDYVHGYPSARTPNDIVALNSQGSELLAEGGLVGFGLFYGFLLTALVQAAMTLGQSKPSHRRAWVAGLSLAVVAMTVQAQSFSGFFLMHLWVGYGLLVAAATPVRRPD